MNYLRCTGIRQQTEISFRSVQRGNLDKFSRTPELTFKLLSIFFDLQENKLSRIIKNVQNDFEKLRVKVGSAEQLSRTF